MLMVTDDFVYKGEPDREARPSYDPKILCVALHLTLKQGDALSVLLANELTDARTLDMRLRITPDARRVLLHRLRTKLLVKKIYINSHQSIGYSITNADRDRIHEWVEKFRNT